MENRGTDKPICEKHSVRQRMLAMAGSAVAFLVVYLVLAGPVAAIHRAVRFAPVQNAIEVVYAPVVFVVRNRVEPLATVMRAWIEVFR